MKNKQRISLILLFFASFFTASAQEIPSPLSGRMVNDFAGVLSDREEASLEHQLREFNDSTSTQIAVVTVKDLDGMSISEYATELGHKWGVGTKGKDNGIVILFKPKTADSRGEVFIAVGYGLEGAVPDATAKMIVEREIIPYFKENRIGAGFSQAVSTLFSLVKGEYTADAYSKQSKSMSSASIFYLIIIIFIIISLILPGKKRSNTITKDGATASDSMIPWLLLAMMSGSRGGHSGGFGGGGGSSFGGFGGGGFGGGGSGGSW
ncbi:MAG: TPM domain-containing protein [Rikenellaceae bacterium]